MRVLVMSFGTRGDIQPYAARAGALARAGDEVTLAVPAGDRMMGAVALLGAGLAAFLIGRRDLTA